MRMSHGPTPLDSHGSSGPHFEELGTTGQGELMLLQETLFCANGETEAIWRVGNVAAELT